MRIVCLFIMNLSQSILHLPKYSDKLSKDTNLIEKIQKWHQLEIWYKIQKYRYSILTLTAQNHTKSYPQASHMVIGQSPGPIYNPQKGLLVEARTVVCKLLTLNLTCKRSWVWFLGTLHMAFFFCHPTFLLFHNFPTTTHEKRGNHPVVENTATPEMSSVSTMISSLQWTSLETRR